MNLKESLLDKYNVPVPRYTSYPPANHFRDTLSAGDRKSLIMDSNDGYPQHMAFYIHIPFCKRICFYCGCNACAIKKGDLTQPYMEALKEEIRSTARLLKKDRKVTQIHYGGGTPNAISSDYISEINELLFSEFDFIDKPEIAIECHPAYLDEAYIRDLADYGFNRFSLGIQDLNEEVLKTVNREGPKIPLEELITMIKGSGDEISVNLDFIYGLPGQDVNGFSRTIEQAISLQPDRLVTFSYAHVPWVKKHQKILEKKGLPDPMAKISLFLAAYDILVSAGYHPVGLDHYVKEDDELYIALENNLLHRNFQGYCTRSTTGQVYAFGASSITQLEKAYIQNTRDTEEYISRINKDGSAIETGLILNNDQVIIREAITDLMCNKMINWKNTAGRLGIATEDLKKTITIDPDALDGFAGDGLLTYDAEGMLLTEKGTLFIRNIAASLDPAYQSETMKYSKSV